jgi:hypothetical protein
MRGESTLNMEYSPDGKKKKKVYFSPIKWCVQLPIVEIMT